MQFTFDMNSGPVEQALESIESSLADNSAAFLQIADDFREMVAEQFAPEGAAGGTPWAALAPSTLRRRRAGSGPLNSTGALLASLIDAGSAGHVEEADGQTLTLGSNLPYAMYHQTGTGRGFGQPNIASGRGLGRGMPMRPILILSDDRVGRWAELVGRSLEQKALVLGANEMGGMMKG
ncbi:MAG TPA: phage virion morphogenesis protein [Terriglobia bacterium]|nr:phage virion morphogenesis protein [Terriglobia bacterium]